jgi:peptidase M1-like protein
VTLTIVYGGRVEPQELEREAIAVAAQDPEPPQIPLEPRFIYSNRSYWYPQSTVTDYATARLRMSVPNEYDVIASGLVTTTVTPPSGPAAETARARKTFLFQSDKPARYLACVISRFSTITSAHLKVPPVEVNALRESATADGRDSSAGPSAPDTADSQAVALVVQANPRQASRARALSQKSTDVFQFYASLVGEAPYPSFTLAVTESDLPGGHSPAYFAVLNQQLPTSQLVWRNDPVAFESYPSFFLAHELAHQWWGQAIGWKNYHEQWISEGFAQYFAALYGEKERGPETFAGLLRQMRRWAIESSDQGPVYLGYRLGHIKSDSRIFRALVYNKGAMVLHMLRRLVGDEAFFTGLRQFYGEWRFAKAGTDDFRRSMEAASNRDLQPFFEGWIYGSSIPRLKVTQQQQGETLLLRFEHRADVIIVPVTVQITYTTGETQELVVAVGERVVERTVPLKGTIRKVDINGDQASLVEIEK